MSIEKIGKEQQPDEVIGVVADAIDLYWENLLKPCSNVLRVTVRDEEDDGRVIQETYTIQRVYDTAYFIKFERSCLESLGGNSPVFNIPIDTLEFRMLPSLFDRGVVSIRHINPNGVGTDTEVLLAKLAQKDRLAMLTLEHLQLNLLALLVGHTKDKPLFDPFPLAIKTLLEEAYGCETAQQLWCAAMS